MRQEARKNPTTGQGDGARRNRKQSHHNSAAAQRQRIMDWLRQHGTLTTCEARRHLDILCPASRIMELRRQGEEIDLVWVDDYSEAQVKHRVGKYLLVARGQ